MIKLTDIGDLLDPIGIPIAYKSFNGNAKDIPDPPYLVYYEKGSDNFGADNITFAEQNEIIIELYSYKRDISLEKKVKDILTASGIYFNTDHADVEDEDIHIAYFFFSILN